jgi:hypothetical protein
MSSSIARTAAAMLLVVTMGRAAHADEPTGNEKALAQSLFDEGRRLMDAGRYAEACPRFADSERLDPGGGTVLNLALCYEKLGKLTLAYGTYGDALSRAITERRSEREAFAREHLALLAGRMPKLTLRVGDAARGLEVRIDGAAVPPSAWGVATPVDPGRHSVEATAPAYARYWALVTVAEGETRELSVVLAQERAEAPPPQIPPAPPRVELRRSPAFYVTGALSLAAVTASVVTGVLAWSAHESVASKCDTAAGYCSDPTGIDDASRARTMAWISTVTLGAGALGAVVAFALPKASYVAIGAAPGSITARASW